MKELRATMLEEVKLDDALQVLRSRKLGFSQVRLLPKGNKLRPIMNLRRRAMVRGPSSKLGRSINTILGPVHSFLKLEKVCEVSNIRGLKLTRNTEDQPVQIGFNYVLSQRYLYPTEAIQAISGP
jgi:telomerase reverse transcriptase